MQNKKEEEKKQTGGPKEETVEERQKRLQAAALQDKNINPLLNNGITNRDIFRTLLFHFKTDNYIPIDKAANFVVNLLKRPNAAGTEEDEAEKRFLKSLYNIMASYAKDKKNLTEDEFVDLMESFKVQNDYEFTDA